MSSTCRIFLLFALFVTVISGSNERMRRDDVGYYGNTAQNAQPTQYSQFVYKPIQYNPYYYGGFQRLPRNSPVYYITDTWDKNNLKRKWGSRVRFTQDLQPIYRRR